MDELSIKELRATLETAGVKTRHVRKEVVDAIYRGEIKQKTKLSATVVPGTVTIEEFIETVTKKYSK